MFLNHLVVDFLNLTPRICSTFQSNVNSEIGYLILKETCMLVPLLFCSCLYFFVSLDKKILKLQKRLFLISLFKGRIYDI